MGRKLFSVGVGEQLQDVDAPREVVEARRWLEDQEGQEGEAWEKGMSKRKMKRWPEMWIKWVM